MSEEAHTHHSLIAHITTSNGHHTPHSIPCKLQAAPQCTQHCRKLTYDHSPAGGVEVSLVRGHPKIDVHCTVPRSVAEPTSGARQSHTHLQLRLHAHRCRPPRGGGPRSLSCHTRKPKRWSGSGVPRQRGGPSQALPLSTQHPPTHAPRRGSFGGMLKYVVLFGGVGAAIWVTGGGKRGGWVLVGVGAVKGCGCDL